MLEHAAWFWWQRLPPFGARQLPGVTYKWHSAQAYGKRPWPLASLRAHAVAGLTLDEYRQQHQPRQPRQAP
jgi:hypothetical protein